MLIQKNQFGTSQGVGEGTKRLLFKRRKKPPGQKRGGATGSEVAQGSFFFFSDLLLKKKPPVTLSLPPTPWSRFRDSSQFFAMRGQTDGSSISLPGVPFVTSQKAFGSLCCWFRSFTPELLTSLQTGTVRRIMSRAPFHVSAPGFPLQQQQPVKQNRWRQSHQNPCRMFFSGDSCNSAHV